MDPLTITLISLCIGSLPAIATAVTKIIAAAKARPTKGQSVSEIVGRDREAREEDR